MEFAHVNSQSARHEFLILYENIRATNVITSAEELGTMPKIT